MVQPLLRTTFQVVDRIVRHAVSIAFCISGRAGDTYVARQQCKPLSSIWLYDIRRGLECSKCDGGIRRVLHFALLSPIVHKII